jgi:glycosyltransferase involved in cell wall biosynthesis
VKKIAVLGIGAHTLPSSRFLLNRLAEKYSITLYAEVPVKEEWLQLPHRYTIRRVFSKTWPRRMRDALYFLRVLIDHLRNSFDLVHAHSNYPTGMVAVALQKFAHVPALVSLEGGEAAGIAELNFGDMFSPRRIKLNQWIINHAKGVTALTHFQRDQAYKNLGVTRSIDVVTRGVDLTLFGRTKKSVGNPLVFLSVGYLSPVKNPELLLRAFHLIQQQVDCVLLHIGKDFMDGAIQRLTNELHLSEKVQFKGPVPYEDLPAHYAQADILLITSAYESQAVVVAEAMASGVVVCGTNVGLVADLSGTCCLSSPEHDAVRLSRSILTLVEDRARMEQLRHNAWEWSSRNSLDHSVAQISTLYEQLGR